jgi:hypothetical protein
MNVKRETRHDSLLAAIAILLGIIAWGQVSNQPMASTAVAQIRSKPAGTARVPLVETDGVSSIGQRSIEQRDELIASLSRLRAGVDGIASSLRNGDIRVRVLEESTGDTSQGRRGEVPR